MVFTSFNFLIFFPLLIVVYYLTPIKYRWGTLLVANYFFYINIKPVYAVLTAVITLSTYFFTRLISKSDSDARRKKWLVVNIIIILLPLFFFKYFGVINNSLFELLEANNIRWPLPEIKLLLPIGISFYTFMAIGYSIDVYNEEIEAERNLGILALFVSFWPLVLSGPIERAKNMLPQFRNFQSINYRNISKGLKLMLWGYFMKLVIADRLGIYVDAVFANVMHHNGTTLLVASVLYPFQIYGDLGGYSLIAIGASKAMGFEVIENFRRPFFSTSMAEFWRRWHISLIKWLTDYIYTPLSFGLRQIGKWGIVVALLVTFIISGIWHGAALTFIIWGLIQGIFLSIESMTKSKRSNIEKKYNLNRRVWYTILGCFVTFIMFSGSLVFGRSPDMKVAMSVFSKIISSPGPLFLDMTSLTYSLSGLLVLLLKDFMDEYFPGKIKLWENDRIIIRYISYLAILFYILLTGVLNGSQFIYFQF